MMDKMYSGIMSLMRDRQVRRYYVFLLSFSLVLFTVSMLFCGSLTRSAKAMLLSHDEAVASSLIRQGIPENVIAEALTSTNAERTPEGSDLLRQLGLRPTLDTLFLPQLGGFRRDARRSALIAVLPVCGCLLGVSLLFLHGRESLYRDASSVVDRYIDGDYSCRLPQNDEGAVYRLFFSIDRLATMLQAQNESEQKSRVFLRDTISDISHQLKTPLAALSMYQEIMENEPDHPAVIQQFAAKTGLALKRMEQLIQSMLKITKLDAGNIVFEKQPCNLSALVSCAVSELTTRAAREDKTIILEGSSADTLLCDTAWTREAIGNLVKNALDHTDAGGMIRIAWEVSSFAGIIRIADDGSGIAPEDIHHIFKRFYRSSQSMDTQGIGLGLPLAKSIMEGQGGTISLQSVLNVGTTFTLMFPS